MENLKTAIEVLAKKAQEASSHHEAMQYAQAALNLANAAATLGNIKQVRSAPVPLTDDQRRALIKQSELWDMHIHIGWYSAPSKHFVEKAMQLIADIEAAHGIKGRP